MNLVIVNIRSKTDGGSCFPDHVATIIADKTKPDRQILQEAVKFIEAYEERFSNTVALTRAAKSLGKFVKGCRFYLIGVVSLAHAYTKTYEIELSEPETFDQATDRILAKR